MMSMTLEEAIEHAEEQAMRNEKEFGLCPYPSQECNGTQDCRCLENGEGKGCLKCAKEHRQLAEWLRELQERRKQPEIIHCGECLFNDGTAYCEVLFMNVKGNDYCSWAERRTDDKR